MPKFNLGFDAAGKEKKLKKKKKRRGADPEIDIRINRGQTVMLADEAMQSTVRAAQELTIKYVGKYLYREGYALTIGVGAETGSELEYEEDDIVLITFVEQKSLYFFNARINVIREAAPGSFSERFEIEQPKAGVNEEHSGYIYDKYIFELIPVTPPEKQQRREFFRMNLGVDIYYKMPPLDISESSGLSETEEGEDSGGEHLSLGSLTYNELQYEYDHARDGDDGYVKLRTMDFSAGGFRAKSKVPIESGVVLECMIIVGFEALPATVKVLSARQHDKNDIKNGVYDLRAIFIDMSDQIRDRIVRYIFAQQRQIQARHSRKQQHDEENRRK
jgi:hypothetical protein